MKESGRPRKFNTVQELEDRIQEYFDLCVKTEKYITISGLAYYLGFESRQSFYDYEKNDIFSYTIKRARLFIESDYEQHLRKHGTTADIFALKNFGWKDKTEVETTVNSIPKIEIIIDE